MTEPEIENLEVTGEMTITETVEERIHVPSGAVLVLIGVAHDGVLVTGGGCAHISGETQTLTVAVGGRATLTGICHGPLINDGGEVIIEGVVEGPITEYAGQTIITPTATRGSCSRPGCEVSDNEGWPWSSAPPATSPSADSPVRRPEAAPDLAGRQPTHRAGLGGSVPTGRTDSRGPDGAVRTGTIRMMVTGPHCWLSIPGIVGEADAQ